MCKKDECRWIDKVVGYRSYYWLKPVAMKTALGLTCKINHYGSIKIRCQRLYIVHNGCYLYGREKNCCIVH